MIVVENLTKYYGSFLALDNISFTIKEGEIVGFLGPNGAGKTTTIRIITTFLPPTSGKVYVAGYDVTERSVEVREKIGYLPENTPLYPELRVKEYLNFRAELKKVKDRKKAIDRVIEECKLGDVVNALIGELSKGYRQRVGLADALISDPPILILDEPTLGLDPLQIRQTRQLIKELGKERTVFISSHILPEIEQIASKAIIINKGRIVGEGSIEELREKAGGFRKIFVEARDHKGKENIKDVVESLRNIEEVENVEYEEEEDKLYRFSIKSKGEGKRGLLEERIFELFVEKEWVLRKLYTEALTLEEVFAEITTKEEEVEEREEEKGEDREEEKEEKKEE